MKTNITVPGKGVVGYVEGDTFYKTVSGSKHFYRRELAIGNDIALLNECRKMGVVIVHVFDRETKVDYYATIAHIFEKGVKHDLGFGEQIFLTFSEWGREPPKVE